MISFTDVLHDLVRRGLTLRIDQAGNLFIYDSQTPVRSDAAKAEGATAAEEAGRTKHTSAASGSMGGAKSPQTWAARRAADAALAARRHPRPIPDSGMPSPPPSDPKWRGITWQDVPGHDESVQRLNFALLKRGMLRGHKCCGPLEGEALKQRLQDLSQRNRDNSQARRAETLRRNQSTPRRTPP